ncbi:MAG: peptidoglycan DD-metalloendopeptidase family protein [Eubacterium sp.]|nr:peptidoglycan DD-metalloendopeptidase family protein [Eubacterium sp.]
MFTLFEKSISIKKVALVTVMSLAIGTMPTNLFAAESTPAPSSTPAVEADSTATPAIEQTASPVATPEATADADSKKKNTLVIKKKKCKYPKSIYEGQSFSLAGTLKSNHKLKKVVTSIVNEDGENQIKVKSKANSKKFNIKTVDSDIKFGTLESGTYKYKVKATDKYGYSKTAISKKFVVKESNWLWPVDGGVLGCKFHCHCPVHNGKHYGIDIRGVKKGTKIFAVNDGEVVYSQYHSSSSGGSYGNLVILYHGNGIYSFYAHCNRLKRQIGDKVEKGDVIATVGSTGFSTGNHLHFELRKGPKKLLDGNDVSYLDKTTYKQFNPLKKKYLGCYQ